MSGEDSGGFSLQQTVDKYRCFLRRRQRETNSQLKPVRKGARTSGMSKKSILVIDDDKSILRTFTRILQKTRCDIDVAETGREAIEKGEKRHYDLALVDVRLPDMDGTDLLAKMKDTMRDTVKIVITGFPSMEVGVKALDEGADAYLVKPVKPEDLLMLIEEKLKCS
jgi:DNA-binding NtrC family response regulator